MKKYWLLAGFILLVLGVGVGFLLQQSTTPSAAASAQEPTEPGKAEKVLEIAVEKNINGEITSGHVQIRFEDPETLPTTGESALGVFLGQDGEVITLGTGRIEVAVEVTIENDEEPVRSVSLSHSGASVDIIVNTNTVIYADITPAPEISEEDLEFGSKTVTRTIVPGKLNAIGEGMILRVWGPKQDGVVSAEILVYETIE